MKPTYEQLEQRLLNIQALMPFAESLNAEAQRELKAQAEELAAARQQIEALAAENVGLRSERGDIAKIGELIRTQDNRLTDQPFFAVMVKREMITEEGYDHDRICWVENQSGDYVEATDTQHRRLEAIYQGRYEVRRGWDRYAMKEIDVFVTGCFTEQGCNDYIRQNRHNLNKPFVYAFGSYRNYEYQTVRKFIMEMPETPATDAALAELAGETIKSALDKCCDYFDTDCVMESMGISYESASIRVSGALAINNALTEIANQLRGEASK